MVMVVRVAMVMVVVVPVVVVISGSISCCSLTSVGIASSLSSPDI